jgi:outer membrane lipopolysaccharide assembly protein LptE/RlpB
MIAFRWLTRNLSVPVGILLIAGCGFALRGADQINIPLERLSLSYPSGHYPLGPVMADALRSNGVDIPAANSQDYGLLLSPEHLERRAVSINTRGRAGQYEILLNVDASLLLGEQLLAGPLTFTAQGAFFEDTANISGANSGLELVLNDLRIELAQQMIRRLQSMEF